MSQWYVWRCVHSLHYGKKRKEQAGCFFFVTLRLRSLDLFLFLIFSSSFSRSSWAASSCRSLFLRSCLAACAMVPLQQAVLRLWRRLSLRRPVQERRWRFARLRGVSALHGSRRPVPSAARHKRDDAAACLTACSSSKRDPSHPPSLLLSLSLSRHTPVSHAVQGSTV